MMNLTVNKLERLHNTRMTEEQLDQLQENPNITNWEREGNFCHFFIDVDSTGVDEIKFTVEVE